MEHTLYIKEAIINELLPVNYTNFLISKKSYVWCLVIITAMLYKRNTHTVFSIHQLKHITYYLRYTIRNLLYNLYKKDRQIVSVVCFLNYINAYIYISISIILYSRQLDIFIIGLLIYILICRPKNILAKTKE